jgi:AcrR family transcriptional regulator
VARAKIPVELPSDGRRARSARSRAAVVAAFLDLVAETGRQPTIEEVADRAGVSVRSVYRLFPDTESLLRAAVEDEAASLGPSLQVEVSPTAPLATRVGELVARRAKVYDRLGALRRVVLSQRRLDPATVRVLDEGRASLRRQLSELFAKELSRRAGAARNDLLDSLEMVAGWSGWQTLRFEQGLSVARARRVTESALTALLTARRA